MPYSSFIQVVWFQTTFVWCLISILVSQSKKIVHYATSIVLQSSSSFYFTNFKSTLRCNLFGGNLVAYIAGGIIRARKVLAEELWSREENGGDALEFSRTLSARFSRQSRKNGNLCPNTSKCLPSRLWEWRLRRQISYRRKNNSPTYAGYLVVFFIATYQIFSPRLFCGSLARDILLSRFPIFWQRACSQSIILFVKSHSVSPLDSLKKKNKTKQNKKQQQQH